MFLSAIALCLAPFRLDFCRQRHLTKKTALLGIFPALNFASQLLATEIIGIVFEYANTILRFGYWRHDPVCPYRAIVKHYVLKSASDENLIVHI